MPRGQKSKLRAREKCRQNKAEAQGLERVQAAAGEEEEAACSSSSVFEEASSSPTGAVSLQVSPSAPDTTGATAGVSCKRSGKAKGRVHKSKNASQASTSTKSSGQDILLRKKANILVKYLLNQYKMEQPVRKAEMLKIVHKWYEKDFPEILRRASERIDLFFGLELKEDKSNSNFYTLVEIPSDISSGSLSSGWDFPRKGMLMPLLSVIFLNGNRASEEHIWAFLNTLGIYDGQSHFLFGEPRKIITKTLVKEKYLVFRLVRSSFPPRREFQWGPRAKAETNKMKVLEFLAKINNTEPSTIQPQYEEALKEQQERRQTRAYARDQAASTSTAGPPSKVSRSSRAAACCVPHPE
ncbi:melanoma-associated antigen B2-like [Saccopteryx bilineata]|uniref:melanoma-associated antigen B2-like n=1 Tax=Saccopteryx bilineata TaxID=59482 RepID=UPI00338F46E5